MPSKDIGRQSHTVHWTNKVQESPDEYSQVPPFQEDWLAQYNEKTLIDEISTVDGHHHLLDNAAGR